MRYWAKEPHQSALPHFHLLVYIDKEKINIFIQLFNLKFNHGKGAVKYTEEGSNPKYISAPIAYILKNLSSYSDPILDDKSQVDTPEFKEAKGKEDDKFSAKTSSLTWGYR